MKSGLLVAISAGFILSACATAPAPDLVDTMPAAALVDQVRYDDNPLNEAILADTRSLSGIQAVEGARVDFFFAGAKDRETGRIVFGLHMRTYTSQWLFPTEIRFGSPLVTREFRRGDSDVDCSSYGCSHWEAAMAVLSEADIKQLLQGPDVVPVRVQTQKGYFDATLRTAEVTALLTRMSELQKYSAAS
jgi:hypothetical protein